LIHPPTGDHSMTSSSEIAALKARMSQLETALEGMKRRPDASTASQKGIQISSSAHEFC
jgi:hypothetical protein